MSARWDDGLDQVELTQDDLDNRFMRLIAEAYPDEQVEHTGPLSFTLSTPDDFTLHISLDNVWRQIVMAPSEERAAIIERFAHGMIQEFGDVGTDDAPGDLDAVLPVIKDDRFLRGVEEQTGGAFKIVSRRLVADLSVVYVFDLPDGMRFIQEGDVEPLKTTPEELHERAIENLRRVARERLEAHVVDGSIKLLEVGENDYNASMLLDSEFWVNVASEGSGAVLACVPSRNTLIFADATATNAAPLLQRLALRIEEEASHLISSTLLQFTAAGGWTAYRDNDPPRRVAQAPAAVGPPARQGFWARLLRGFRS